ncbi:hypothetical protein ACFOYW_16890 [Gryllotalpicola reticulitermitis]|uniref:Uncharacterized protein n=1 Tax=Gryllotalpicola reticulitermitis TaxID=1184153 RepID=A0ABV8QC76_9MICO
MGQPNLGPDYALAHRITQLEKHVRAQANANPLINSQIGSGGLLVNGTGGITITDGGGLTIHGGGAIAIDDGGSLELNGGGNIALQGGDVDLSSGNLNVTGDGSIAVTGTGEVTVDGLALSALKPAAIYASASGYALAAALTPVASATVTVPTGYTTALINCILSANYASPNTGTTEYGSSQIAYTTSQGGSGTSANFDVSIADGGVASNAVGYAIELTGLTDGETITLTANVSGGVAGTANAYNVASLGGTMLFIA